MQYPVGCEFNPDTMRNEMVSFADVALSPFAIDKFCHTVTSSWIIGAVFTVAVGCYYLLKKREEKLAVESIKIGAAFGLLASLLAAGTGDGSAYRVASVQPMKLAAMEALYDGGTDVSLTAVAWVSPFSQPDYSRGGEPPLRIGIPCGLSFLATRDAHGYVPGINDLIKGGYKLPDGTTALSLDEKISRGSRAVNDLAAYRSMKSRGSKDVHADSVSAVLDRLKANMPYFGYGYVSDAGQIVPFIPVCFWAFRAMVGLGALFIIFFAVVLFMVYRKDIAGAKWLHVAALAMLPLGYIASEAGWIVAEFGRQPWTIQDMLPTWVAVSDIGAGSVMLTFFIFLALFTTLLAAEITILCKAIKKGPRA